MSKQGEHFQRVLQLGNRSQASLETNLLFPILEQKKARLKVFVVDGCSTEKQILTARGIRHTTSKKIYQSLLSTNGVIKIFSSKHGQYSYGSKYGSFFTNALLESLHHFTRQGVQELQWKDLLECAKQKTQAKATHIARLQEPIFHLKTRARAE